MRRSQRGKNQGTKNFKAKLYDAAVLEIFREQKVPQVQLARKFGVNEGQISKIRRGQQWAWLTQSPEKDRIVELRRSKQRRR